MIFQHTWRKVIKGQKTCTTRRARNDVAGSPLPCRYIVGRTYAVQRERGGRGIARIRIVNVERRESLESIDDAYARAEGFSSVAEFREAFVSINHHGLELPVFSIWFELVRNRPTSQKSAMDAAQGGAKC